MMCTNDSLAVHLSTVRMCTNELQLGCTLIPHLAWWCVPMTNSMACTFVYTCLHWVCHMCTNDQQLACTLVYTEHVYQWSTAWLYTCLHWAWIPVIKSLAVHSSTVNMCTNDQQCGCTLIPHFSMCINDQKGKTFFSHHQCPVQCTFFSHHQCPVQCTLSYSVHRAPMCKCMHQHLYAL